MTLRELVEKYDGEIMFAVSRAVSGGVEEIVDFSNTEYKAIKDDIISSTVSKYSITTSSTTREITISVVLDEVVEESASDATVEEGAV